MSAQVLEFKRPEPLARGERPKRRTDAERLRELDAPVLHVSFAEEARHRDLITFAKLGAPPESA